MTMREFVSPKSSRALVAAALLLGSAAAAGAQSTTQLASADERWTPWVGCWQASARDEQSQELAPNKSAPVVCVVPVKGDATVDLVTITDGKVGEPERVDANGSRRNITREGCDGWETANFSPDTKRIYLKSEYKCTGNRTRLSTGLMSISPTGEWLDVQNVKVESHSGVRVVHYGRVPVPAVLSADMRSALENTGMATNIALMAAGDSVRVAEVVEATKQVDPLVVQTWLAQRGQGFNLDAKRLTELANAKVPENVIDVMVALSYPRAFAINLAQADGQIVPTGNVAQANAQEDLRDGPTVYMNWDPFYANTYGYYGNSYYYRGGLGGGYNGYPWYYNNTPVVITRPSGSVEIPATDTRGRMVRGSGYTRPADRADGGSSGTPRSSTSDGGSRSSGSTGSSSTGAGSSEPRTAKPRP